MSIQNYSRQRAGSVIDRLALKKRLHMLQLFLKAFPDTGHNTILDVGVTADREALSSNYFEQYYPNKENITALSNQPASFLETIYPGIRFTLGDAKQLPFADQSFDVVFSSAVIEHLGSHDNQQTMLQECFRVARKGVFVTTPNRWHPMEVHTLLPLIHWLPKAMHRKLLNLLGISFYAQESNLNLLDTKTLHSFCNHSEISNFTVHPIKTAGFTSNLILIIKK